MEQGCNHVGEGGCYRGTSSTLWLDTSSAGIIAAGYLPGGPLESYAPEAPRLTLLGAEDGEVIGDFACTIVDSQGEVVDAFAIGAWELEDGGIRAIIVAYQVADEANLLHVLDFDDPWEPAQ